MQAEHLPQPGCPKGPGLSCRKGYHTGNKLLWQLRHKSRLTAHLHIIQFKAEEKKGHKFYNSTTPLKVRLN